MGRAYHEFSVGLLEAVTQNGFLTELSLVDKRSFPDEPNELTDNVFSQLEEYFSGARRSFDLPLNPRGTDFQRAVWKALVEIPYAQTRSYGQIAAAVGKPKAARAVGMANNKNPIIIIIPCHRVIGADGSLTGYGCGLPVKRALLELEKQNT